MTDSPASAASHSLAAVADGYLTTQLLFIAARLQLADSVAASPRSGEGDLH
jgi:hypothetical protein